MILARENAERRKAIWEMWEPAGGSKHGHKASPTGSQAVKDRRRSAQTAEKAARAARR